MRKFLFCVLILLLAVLMFFVAWYDIPGLSMITTYQEIEVAYNDYQKTLNTLKTKNDVELPKTLAKLDPEYESTDRDNVVKQYNDNKSNYEQLVAFQKNNSTIGAADIYDVEFLWTNLGVYATSNFCYLNMDIKKSDADLESEDYIMCNLEFQVAGLYSSIAQFIEEIEMDPKIGFQINDFFMEGISGTARNQSRKKTMDTDNIPTQKEFEQLEEESETEEESELIALEEEFEKIGIRASFKVYNVPINRRTITNVKSADEISTDLLDEEVGEEVE